MNEPVPRPPDNDGAAPAAPTAAQASPGADPADAPTAQARAGAADAPAADTAAAQETGATATEDRSKADADAAADAGPPSARDVAGRRWRRVRGPLAGAIVVILAGIVLAALQSGPRYGYLDPESPGKDGSRALVRITEQRETTVQVVHTVADATQRLRSAPDALLVVTRGERLLDTDLPVLAQAPGDRILVEPTPDMLAALAPGVQRTGRAGDARLSPDCGLRAATLAGTAEIGGRTYTAPPGATKCYLDDGRAALIQLRLGKRTVTVLGSGRPFTNERLEAQGNAALGMSLLMAKPNVVWLFPDAPPPGSTGDKSPGELLPPSVLPVIAQLAIATVLVALWRVRRLGRVVTEPLPVVVRSAETVEGRARLYRARRARDRAAAALRAGTLERLTPLLGLSRSVVQRSIAGDTVRQVEIVSAIAARTGADPDTIGWALYGPPPGEDTELIRLADHLDEIEGRVRES